MAESTRYATVADLQAYIQDSGTFSAAEAEHQALMLDAASRAIDRETRRFFGTSASATARVFSARDPMRLVVPDLVSVSSLKTDTAGSGSYDRTWSAADYILWPSNAPDEFDPRPYCEVRVDLRTGSNGYTFPTGAALGVEVTGVWGWPAVPDDIKAVCLLEAHRLLMLSQNPSGIVQNQTAGTATVVPELHPTSRRVLASYRRMGRAHG